jgi:hypothetical protein
LVEDFAADLRARFVATATHDGERSKESWKSSYTHQLFS